MTTYTVGLKLQTRTKALTIEAEGRELEDSRLLAEDVGERAPEGFGRPDGGAAGDADRKTVRREVRQFRGDEVGNGVDAQERLVQTVEMEDEVRSVVPPARHLLVFEDPLE